MEATTAKDAPALTPSRSGEARGLLVIACIRAPETAERRADEYRRQHARKPDRRDDLFPRSRLAYSEPTASRQDIVCRSNRQRPSPEMMSTMARTAKGSRKAAERLAAAAGIDPDLRASQ